MAYINTDDNLIALRRRGLASEIEAARMSIRQLDAAMAHKRDFAFETTLSSRHSIRTIERARTAGYRVGLIYVLLQNVELHMARIRTRVELGGHFVRDAEVARRYHTSLKNLAGHLELFDEGYVIDNSLPDTPRRVIRITSGRVGKLPDFDRRLDFDNFLWDAFPTGSRLGHSSDT